MILRNLIGKEWREDVGKMNLACVFEVSLSELEILAHDAELDVLRAEHMA